MPLLIMELRTNYVPDTDFTHVEAYAYKTDEPIRNYLSLQNASDATEFEVYDGVPGVAVRAAEWEIPRGTYRMMARILDERGRVVDSSVNSVHMPDHNFGFTVRMLRR